MQCNDGNGCLMAVNGANFKKSPDVLNVFLVLVHGVHLTATIILDTVVPY